jgi:hypothetical protein
MSTTDYKKKGITWSNHTTASNNTTGPIKEASRNRVYPHPVPNASNSKKAEMGANLVESRKSIDINRGNVGKFSTMRISGVTEYEATYAAKLLENMTPCEAIRALHATPSKKLLGLPGNFVELPPWNEVFNRPLTITPGRRTRNRRRHNVIQERHLGYKEKERIAWLIASQYDIDMDDCLRGKLTDYERPNNLPNNVAHGRMENFVGGKGRRTRRNRKVKK